MKPYLHTKEIVCSYTPDFRPSDPFSTDGAEHLNVGEIKWDFPWDWEIYHRVKIARCLREASYCVKQSLGLGLYLIVRCCFLPKPFENRRVELMAKKLPLFYFTYHQFHSSPLNQKEWEPFFSAHEFFVRETDDYLLQWWQIPVTEDNFDVAVRWSHWQPIVAPTVTDQTFPERMHRLLLNLSRRMHRGDSRFDEEFFRLLAEEKYLYLRSWAATDDPSTSVTAMGHNTLLTPCWEFMKTDQYTRPSKQYRECIHWKIPTEDV